MGLKDVKTKVGIAILSFAHSHQYQWVEAFGKDSRAEIVGFWDSDPERAQTAAARTGLSFFPRLDDLLGKENVNAAAVCSETSEHPMLVRECCRHRLAVMCEKPTAKNPAEARAVKDMVDSAGIPFLQVFPQRLITGNIRIKELLDEAALGRITHVRKRHGHGFGLQNLSSDMPWIVDNSFSGGGAYMDEGVHETDLLRHYFGMPISVCAMASRLKCGDGEMSATALYQFPNDISVVHEAGWNWIAGGPTTEIYGEKGVLLESLTDCASSVAEGYLPHLAIFRKKTGNWETLEQDYDFSSVHKLFPVSFLDMILDGSAPVASVDDGVQAVEMVHGVYRSIDEKRTIEF